jgi:GNAT superfamily N-acetyltransferase
MEDTREHPNPQGLDELYSVGLGPGRLIEAGDLFRMQIEKATGFKVATNSELRATGPKHTQLYVHVQTHDKETVARFNFELFPGNQDIVVSTGSFVSENRRGVGIGWQMLKARMNVAKQVGFQMLLATVEKTNIKERELLLRNGFIQEENTTTGTANFYCKKL